MSIGYLYIVKRLDELAKRASFRREAVFTHFLDLAQAQLATRSAQAQGVKIVFFGGYEEAERVMAAYYADDPPEEWEWPIQPVRISWRPQFGSPAHRDLLGALMALGFERERMGDIVLDQGCAWLFAENDIADYIVSSLTSAGRVTVKCEKVDVLPPMPQPEGRTARDTVPSLRLDALIAAAFSLSRSEAALAVTQGRVLVNQVQSLRVDEPVEEGALLSVRGSGRVKLVGVDGETKKGRIAVRFFIYGGKK